eukprot:TRINITY_DN778_c0_g1_i3.p1 TRINITY_DN778_c0_g1~~TRINITY_DN778_c0_g1_i3.p1  ORF type:complete len:555 (+),score=157.07 TRINITY_DN778_c0_g1_i3:128-1792(+)
MSDSETFNRVKVDLLKADNDGYSVYEHLVNMVSKAFEGNSKVRSGDSIPSFSKQIKHSRFRTTKQEGAKKAVLDERDVARAAEEKKLFHKPKPVVTTKVHKPTMFTTVTTTVTEPVTVPPLRPITEDQRFHKLCGYGLLSSEYFLLEQSMSNLVRDKKLEEAAFFGRVFGTEQNYTIVVSKRLLDPVADKIPVEKYSMPKPPRKGVDVPIQSEPPGVGLNRVTFWVCQYAGGPWTELPDVTPQQIISSQKIKKYLTGNLDAPVNSYPPFPGKEINYLRAQLARIWSSSTVAPEGEVEAFVAEDEEEEEEEEENPNAIKYQKFNPLTSEAKPIQLEEGIESLATSEKWVHTRPFIYKTGRGTQLPPKPEPEEDEAAEEPEDEEEKEPEEEPKELLQPIATDKKYATIKVPQEPKETEEGQEEPEEEDDDKEDDEAAEDDPTNPKRITLQSWTAHTVNNFYKKHGVVVVRSLRWPGACSWVTANKTSGTIYFGDGSKSTDAAFAPELPPPIQQEVDDLQEVADPTSMLEKLILRGEDPKENDSEDEANEDEEEAAE